MEGKNAIRCLGDAHCTFDSFMDPFARICFLSSPKSTIFMVGNFKEYFFALISMSHAVDGANIWKTKLNFGVPSKKNIVPSGKQRKLHVPTSDISRHNNKKILHISLSSSLYTSLCGKMGKFIQHSFYGFGQKSTNMH